MSRQRTLWLASAALVAATALVGSPAVAQEDPEAGFENLLRRSLRRLMAR